MSDLSSRNDSKLIPKYLVKCKEGRDINMVSKGRQGAKWKTETVQRVQKVVNKWTKSFYM